MKKFFKILTIFIACVFGVAIIAGVAGNFYFGDLNVPDWIDKIKDGINSDKPDDHTHEYTETVIQATCTAQGYTLYECECGESYKSDYTAMTAHHYVCADCGAAELECSDNESGIMLLSGITSVNFVSDKYPLSVVIYHADEYGADADWEETVTISNSTNSINLTEIDYISSINYQNLTPLHCNVHFPFNIGSVITFTIKLSFLSAAHNYVDYVCTVCGAVDPEKPVSHTHNYAETVVPGTCTTQGYTLYECECGESYQDDYTEMTPHCYVCTECGSEKNENSGDNSVNTVAYPWAVDCLPFEVRYGKE